MKTRFIVLPFILCWTLQNEIPARAFEIDAVQATSLGLVAMPTIGASASLGMWVNPTFFYTATGLMTAILINNWVAPPRGNLSSEDAKPRTREWRQEILTLQEEARELIASPDQVPSEELEELLSIIQESLADCRIEQEISDHEVLLFLATLSLPSDERALEELQAPLDSFCKRPH